MASMEQQPAASTHLPERSAPVTLREVTRHDLAQLLALDAG
jgi:hypothetical protein